ncbi:MAG TPA: hypothetical protein VLG76_05480 [Rhabdochlamydiaceae bacterium]|nr:hypothetical protein [Rhabdochlamydiaceae bacterium]
MTTAGLNSRRPSLSIEVVPNTPNTATTTGSESATMKESNLHHTFIAPRLSFASNTYNAFRKIASPSSGALIIQSLKAEAAKESANAVYLISPRLSSSPETSGSSGVLSPSSESEEDFLRATPLSELTSDDSSFEEEQFVFKPTDEAIGNINSKVRGGIQPKLGILGEEQPMMECLARHLARPRRKNAIVPPTAFLTINFANQQSQLKSPSSSTSSHSECEEIAVFTSSTYKDKDASKRFASPFKTGSAQKFIPDTKSLKEIPADDRDARIEQIPRDQVHDLTILDIRGCNADRHLGNILMHKKDNGMTAIDHGCLGTKKFLDPALFCWMDWPQARLPFSKDQKAYIKHLNWEKTKEEILKDFPSFPHESLETLRFSQLLLQEGAKADLTPFGIGCFLTGLRLGSGMVLDSPMQLLSRKIEELVKNPGKRELELPEYYLFEGIKGLVQSLSENMSALEEVATIHRFLIEKIEKAEF